jgi:hypothetical protein
LPYQHSKRFTELRELPRTQVPSWILLWSNISTINKKAIIKLKNEGWAHLPYTDGDIVFFQTERPDGSVFPKDNDLQKGIDILNNKIYQTNYTIII